MAIFPNRFIFICVLVQMGIRQIVKFLYIFKLKFCTSIHDDFAAFFLTLWNIMVCASITFTTQFFGFHNAEVDFHVCVGKNPDVMVKESFQYMKWFVQNESDMISTFKEVSRRDPFGIVTVVIITILSTVSIFTWLFSTQNIFTIFLQLVKGKVSKDSVFVIPTTNNNFTETRSTIIGNGAQLKMIIISIVLMFPHIYMRQLVSKNAQDLNHGLGRSLFYIVRMTTPFIAYFNIPIIIILSNKKMRRTLFRELKNYFQIN